MIGVEINNTEIQRKGEGTEGKRVQTHIMWLDEV